jgi:DNA polymerase III subunit epsilon
MTLAPLPPNEFEALEGLARTLTSWGWYRVARRFQPRRCYGPADGRAIRTALYVDVETTGLTDDDRIIELAALPFTYAVQTGEVCDVGEGYCAFEDPGRPIPEAVTSLTGITDDLVRGRQIR